MGFKHVKVTLVLKKIVLVHLSNEFCDKHSPNKYFDVRIIEVIITNHNEDVEKLL